MTSHRLLIVLGVCLLLAGTFAVACGGGGGGNKNEATDLSKVPTATAPNPLPDVVIVNGSGQSGSGTTYTVEPGDSLSVIAEQFGVTVEAIADANGITDPTSLFAGQVLVIPAAEGDGDVLGSTQEPPATATATPRPSNEGGGTYTVQEGDIPETIAAQFGITAEELMAANDITDPTSLQVGQELVIPTPSP